MTRKNKAIGDQFYVAFQLGSNPEVTLDGLIDNGSQISGIDDDLARELRLTFKETTPIKYGSDFVTGNQEQWTTNRLYEVPLQKGAFNETVTFYGMHDIDRHCPLLLGTIFAGDYQQHMDMKSNTFHEQPIWYRIHNVSVMESEGIDVLELWPEDERTACYGSLWVATEVSHATDHSDVRIHEISVEDYGSGGNAQNHLHGSSGNTQDHHGSGSNAQNHLHGSSGNTQDHHGSGSNAQNHLHGSSGNTQDHHGSDSNVQNHLHGSSGNTQDHQGSDENVQNQHTNNNDQKFLEENLEPTWEDKLRTDKNKNIPATKTIPRQFIVVKTIFVPLKGVPDLTKDFDLHIDLPEGAIAPARRAYRLSAPERAELRKNIKQMLEAGTIRKSTSQFAAPVLFVKKKGPNGDELRMCFDYRQLNAITIKVQFPIPLIKTMLDKLHSATWFTTLDLQSGYNQVRIREEDVHKAAFICEEGLFEPLVMPFGLCNAPALFQRMMTTYLADEIEDDFCMVYIDDIMIYSNGTKEDHSTKVLRVLRVLDQIDFTIPNMNVRL